MSLFDFLSNILNKNSNQVKKEPEEIVIDYTDSAKVERGIAIFKETDEYRKSAGDDADLQLIFNKFKEAAILGCTQAQFELHCLYALGHGTPKNPREADRWLIESAEHGYVAAQLHLGLCYEVGMGATSYIKRDKNEAYKWYMTVANQGNAEGWYRLAKMHDSSRIQNGDYDKYKADKCKAFAFYKKSAEMGYDFAMHKLGDMYRFGQGTAKDIPEALKWYKLAAENGFADAQYLLAEIYRKGDGVEVDKQEAVRWYKMCAEKDEEYSSMEFAQMYRYGEGVEVNKEEAFRLYKICAEKGNKHAQYILAEMYRYGEGTKRHDAGELGFIVDYYEAFEWYWKAAEQNYEPALMLIADVFRHIINARLEDGQEGNRSIYGGTPDILLSMQYKGENFHLEISNDEFMVRITDAFEYLEQQEQERSKKV